MKDRGILVENTSEYFTKNQEGELIIPFTDGSRPLIDFRIDFASNTIYWTTGVTLNRASLDGTSREVLYSETGPFTFADSTLQLDSSASKIYWANSVGIFRSNFDGTERETVAAGLDYTGIRALEIDPANSYIYYARAGSLRRIEFSGANEIEFSTGLGEASALLFDSQLGRILYADSEADTVVAIPTDGSAKQDLYEDIENLHSLAFDGTDTESRRLYYTSTEELGRVSSRFNTVLEAAFVAPSYFDLADDGRIIYSSGAGAVLSANLDGTNRKTLVTGLGTVTGIGVDLNSSIYIADSEQGKIYRRLNNQLREVATGLGEVLGVASALVDGESRIFWTENSDDVGKVVMSPVPFSGQALAPVNIVEGINPVYGIDFDPRTGEIFWAESGSTERKGGIRAAVPGAGTRLVVPLEPETFTTGGSTPMSFEIQPQPRGVDVGNGIYLTESVTLREVLRAKRSDGSLGEVNFTDGNLPVGVRQLSKDSNLCGMTKDIDSDRTSEYVVWRRSTGTWFADLSVDDSILAKQWGLPRDQPLSGDYDGDDRKDLTVWRPGNGTWYHCLSSTEYDCSQFALRQFGLPGDYPVIADFDGDGKDDEAVWRPSTGVWFYFSSVTSAVESIQWGLPGDFPLPGDFDADGIDDFAVWRPSNGNWYALLSSKQRSKESSDILFRQFGLVADHPLVADFDGDEIEDLAVWRQTTGVLVCLPVFIGI